MTPPELNYRVRAYVDWDGDGDYGDIHERLPGLLDCSVSWGRSSATDQVGSGTASLKVINIEGVFDRRNTASPLYGKLLPDRDMYLEMDIQDYGVVRLFTGQTGTIGNSYPVGALYAVTLQCGDAFERLRLRNIRTSLQENKRIDQLIGTALDAADWPALDRDLDVSAITLGQWWEHRNNPVDALLKLAKNSLGGMVYPDRNGIIVFDDYTARSLRTSHMLIEGGQVLDEELRREDFVDKVRFKRAGLDVAEGYTVLYTLNPTGRTIFPGSTYPDNTWNFEYGVAGKDVQEPEPFVDYTFNSEQDGSGVDRTAQVTVASFTSYGGGGQIVWNNLDSSVVHCTAFNVRGQATRRSNDERTIEVASASPVVSGQELSREFEFNDDSPQIKAYAQYLAAVSNTGQTRINLSRMPKNNYELYKLATLSFGDRVTLAIPDAYLTGDWFVEKMQIAIPRNDGLPPRFNVTLFPADMVGGNFFRISDGEAPDWDAVSVTESFRDSNATTHTVTLPDVVEGDLWLMPFTADGGTTITAPDGWTELSQLQRGTNLTGGCFAHIVTGDEGATVDVVTAASEAFAAQVIRYSVEDWCVGTIAESVAAGTPVQSTNTGVSNIDAPAVAPGWALDGANHYVTILHNSSGNGLAGTPASYTGVEQTNIGAGTATAGVATARRTLAVSSDNPGDWTSVGTSMSTVTNTIAIRPREPQTYSLIVEDAATSGDRLSY